MNQDQLLGIARQIFTMAGGIAVGRGWITADMVTAIVGALPALISIYFVYRKASPQGQADAVGRQGMTVVASPEIAKSLPDNARVLSSSDVKVVSK
jgi:hypothetical protein